MNKPLLQLLNSFYNCYTNYFNRVVYTSCYNWNHIFLLLSFNPNKSLCVRDKYLFNTEYEIHHTGYTESLGVCQNGHIRTEKDQQEMVICHMSRIMCHLSLSPVTYTKKPQPQTLPLLTPQLCKESSKR